MPRGVPLLTAPPLVPRGRYWNLQALGNANLLDHALASVRLCWGTQLQITDGCFLELWDPQWAAILPFGAKVPTRPSYCRTLHTDSNPIHPPVRPLKDH